MNTKTTNARYRRQRPFLCLLLMAVLLTAAVYSTTQTVSQNSLEAYRITPPACEKATLVALAEDDRCTVDSTLMLINTRHTLFKEFTPRLSEYGDSGVLMDSSLHDAYRALAQAVKDETDDTLYISSAARERSEQIALYEADPSTAQKPGCSEHEAGLALDVYVKGYAGMGFIKSPAGRFVGAHCQEYGFIIRYPLFGESKTGIGYEPWHIRYVGKPHATLITRFHLTLEEYISALVPDAFYLIDGHIISRQSLKNGTLAIPVNGTDLHVSPDNTGHYIITATLQ